MKSCEAHGNLSLNCRENVPGLKVKQWLSTWRSDTLSILGVPLPEGVRVDEAAHCSYAISRNLGPPGMFQDSILVGCKVNTVDLIFRNIAVQPLNVRTHLFQSFQRLQRHLSDLSLRERARTLNFAFNHELRHTQTSLHQG